MMDMGRMTNESSSNSMKKRFIIIKKIASRAVFLMPIILLLIGGISCFITVGGVMPFWKLIFTEPRNIMEILYTLKTIFPEHTGFWLIWLIFFIVSLYLVGMQKKGEHHAKAMLTKKEPYLIMQSISGTMKQIRKPGNSKEFDAFVYAVKCLEERLSVESDFGYGKDLVIDCENNIAKQLLFFTNAVSDIEIGDFDENIRTLNTIVKSINSLLSRRVELKKR